MSRSVFEAALNPRSIKLSDAPPLLLPGFVEENETGRSLDPVLFGQFPSFAALYIDTSKRDPAFELPLGPIDLGFLREACQAKRRLYLEQ